MECLLVMDNMTKTEEVNPVVIMLKEIALTLSEEKKQNFMASFLQRIL